MIQVPARRVALPVRSATARTAVAEPAPAHPEPDAPAAVVELRSATPSPVRPLEAGPRWGDVRPQDVATPSPGHRRRRGWYELNPGCFGRAALVTLGGAGVAGAGVLTAWRVWRAVRGHRVVRMGRRAMRVWRGYERLRARVRAGR